MRCHNDLNIRAFFDQTAQISNEAVLKLWVEVSLWLLDQNRCVEELRVKRVCICIRSFCCPGESLPRSIGTFALLCCRL